MSRRKRHEEHTNHEAWAIPYADLMTLLLAFFVVMYAVSVVNEGKFRVMSESIIEAFNGSSHVIAPLSPTKVRPHNVTPAIAAPNGQAGLSVIPHPVPMHGRDGRGGPDPDHQSAQQENLKSIEGQVRKALQPLIDKQQVVVRRTKDWLEIEIRTDILFPSGVARLAAPANLVLRNLASILAPFANPLRVEGYTDDVPISTQIYPSNWELSAARAAAVARLFSEHGVNADRLGIIGWGDMRPVADNTSVEGRNRNRRVLVVVLSDRTAPSRFYTDADHIDDETAEAVNGPATDNSRLPTVRVVAPRTASAGAPADLPSVPVITAVAAPGDAPAAQAPPPPPMASNKTRQNAPAYNAPTYQK